MLVLRPQSQRYMIVPFMVQNTLWSGESLGAKVVDGIRKIRVGGFWVGAMEPPLVDQTDTYCIFRIDTHDDDDDLINPM